MATEENMHSITGDICDPDLGKETAEETILEEKTEQSDPATIQQIKEEHDLQVPQMLVDEDDSNLKSCKEQEVKDCDNSSVSTNENRGNVEDQSTSKPFQGQENPTKDQETIHAESTTPAENEEKSQGTRIASKLRNEEVKCEEDGKETATEPSKDSKSIEDGSNPKPTEEAKCLQIVDQSHPKQTTTSKKEASNNAETSEDVAKKSPYRWFRFPKASKEDTPQKNDGQKTKDGIKKEDKNYDIQHVNICGSYLLAIGLVFVCVLIVLGGFIWRIVYAIGGYHDDLLNATDCPTLSPPSNDSNATHHSVMKVLQNMWRNESNEHVSD